MKLRARQNEAFQNYLCLVQSLCVRNVLAFKAGVYYIKVVLYIDIHVYGSVCVYLHRYVFIYLENPYV